MQQLIKENMREVKALCQKHHVRELHVFGNAVQEDFSEKSDVDFLIEFKHLVDVAHTVQNMDALSLALKDLLQRDVDLIQNRLLTNKYLKHFINQEKTLLYAEA